MKKLIVLMIAVLLVMSACSSSNKPANNKESGNDPVSNTASNTTETATSDKTVELPAFTKQSPIVQDYDNNDLTKLIEEKFNVDIQWTLGPSESSLEKQNVLLASGNYPAVFFAGEFSQVDQIKYGKNGILLPLNDLIDKYAPNVKKAFEQSPYLLKAVTAPDGNIYSLPGLEECWQCYYSQKVWINTKWLKKLGIEMPKTTEEFYQVLKAFKEKDPNGNGKNDEIAYTGTSDWWHGNIMHYVMNAFIYASDMNFLTLNNRKVDISANKPEWKEWLSFLHKLYAEGLIDPQSFTQKLDGFQRVLENPDTAIVGAYASGCCYPTAADNGRFTEYSALPPLKGPNGVQLTGFFGGDVGIGLFAITNNASEEQKIKAIQIVNYLFSEEGSLNEMYGPEGVGWKKAKEGDKGLDGKQAIYEQFAYTGDKKQITWDNELKYTPAYLFNGMASGDDITKADSYDKYLNVNTEGYVQFAPKETFPLAIWLNPDEATQLAQMKTDIQTYIDTNAAQFITGQKDVNKEWDSYVKGFSGLSLDQFIKANQEAYDAQYK
jgi:putative aldouronate transport system substrate-binding protein